MKKIIKAEPLPQVIIPDTSILWHSDKTLPVSPDFDQWWISHQSLVSLRLVLPQPVHSELLFQQTMSAFKACDKIGEHITHISGITGRVHKHRVKKDRIRAQIEAKFEKWLHGKGGIVHPIPVDTIEWPRLCNDALWRQPPFTADEKRPEIEKGFRDALILETVAAYISSEASNVNIAFVCGDRLLRDSTALRLATETRFACYETLADVSSYISLTREKLTNQFIQAILRRARDKFFRRDDDACLFYREKIRDTINTMNAELAGNPVAALSSETETPPAIKTAKWELILSRNEISAPKFQQVVGDTRYHWKTTVTRVDLFVSTNTRYVLRAPIEVFWNARVLSDGRFRDVHFDRVEKGSASFEPLSDEILRHHSWLAEEIRPNGT